MSMFHQADRLFIGRFPNGDVRLLKLVSNPKEYPAVDTIFPAHEVVLDVTIPSGHWCSMIASVSRTGEGHFDEKLGKHKWYVATDFHNS